MYVILCHVKYEDSIPSSSLTTTMERALPLLHSQLGVGSGTTTLASSCSRVRVPDVKSSSFFLTLTSVRAVRAASSTPAVATTTTLRPSVSDNDDDDDDATTAFFGGPFEEGELPRPQWSGNEPLSRLVSALISIKPLFALMTVVARQVLINSAEKKGVAWRQMSKDCLSSDVYAEKAMLENPSIIYPDYYLSNFHGYSGGNLSWKAASEVEPATLAVVTRAVPSAESLEEGNQVMRGNWLKAIEDHHFQYSGVCDIRDILDVGCSVGVSTRFLADRFPSAQVTGLDLSSYFLAVAQHKDKQEEKSTGLRREKPIRWLHANGMETGLPGGSYCVVSMAFVLHECPQHATMSLLKEAFRLLRQGGTLVWTDTSPSSKVLQELPPVIFTLLKSTEPWFDEYFSMDVEAAMYQIGFRNIKSVLTDRRHKTVTATVP